MKAKHSCGLLLVFLVITSSLNMAGILETKVMTNPTENIQPNEQVLSESETALWNVTFDSGDSERPGSIFKCQSGGYFVFYSEFVGLPPEHENISIMKIDEYGGQLWNTSVYTFDPELTIDAADMISTSDGGYTVMLSFRNFTSATRFFQLFHLDAECNQLWNRTVPIGNQEYLLHLLESASGDYILLGSGHFENESVGFSVPLVVRTDSTGSLLWNNTYAHLQPTTPADFVETSSGDIVLAAHSLDFHTFFTDCLVISIEGNGNHKWNTTLDFTEKDYSQDLELVQSDEFLLRVLSGTPSVPMLIYLDSSGTPVWSKTYTSGHSFSVNSLQVLADGSLAFVGQMLTDTGYLAAWFMHMNSTGDELWNATYGVHANYAGNSILEVSPDVYILAGDIREGMGEDTTYDLWLAKITIPLLLTPAENQIHEISAHFSYQLNATTPFELDTWILNDSTYFAISVEGLVQNASVVPVGMYGLAAAVNDTQGNKKTTSFLVTVIDTSTPVWHSLPADQMSEYGSEFYYDIHAADHSGVSTYWLNDTRFAMSPAGEITNATPLDLGDYPLMVSVNDTYDNALSQDFTVTVQDTTSPVPNNIEDILFEVGMDPGFWLNWSCTEFLPFSYQLLLDDAPIVSGPWTGFSVEYYVAGHSFGLFNYTVVFEDTSGNTGADTVLVYADDTISPTVNSPLDIYYLEGTTGSSIIWIASDLHPHSYSIYRDGILIRSGGWAEDYAVTVSADGLTPGVYNFTIVVFDVSDNYVVDSVFAVVEGSAVTTTTTSFNETEWQSRVDGQISLLALGLGVIGAISAASIILVLFSIRRMGK
jgi:hypothetical protein